VADQPHSERFEQIEVIDAKELQAVLVLREQPALDSDALDVIS